MKTFIVIEPGLTKLVKNQIITEDEFLKAQDEYGEDQFSAGIGAAAIRECLINIDVEAERDQLREDIKTINSKVVLEKTTNYILS